MKRKIFKYVKFLFCMAIILSLMAPLYATSVNGDAFVTKEEVDKALSDFNNRIVTFKAGINSKIDLQVTSYLDRNGIWSEQKQTSLEPTGWKWQFQNYEKKNGEGEAKYDRHDVFISDKKGLCYMNFKYKINKKGTDQSHKYTWGDQWQNTSLGTTFNVFDSTEVWYVVKDATERITSFNSVGGTPKTGAVGDSSYVYFPLWTKVPDGTPYPVTQIFFVEKGSVYGVELVQYYYMDTTYVSKRHTTYASEMEVYDFKFSVY